MPNPGKYHDSSSSFNESDAENKVMDSLFDLCVSKYGDTSISDVEDHFLNMLASIVDRGELSLSSVENYLEVKGIEGELPKKKVISPRSYNNDYNDRYRSTC